MFQCFLDNDMAPKACAECNRELPTSTSGQSPLCVCSACLRISYCSRECQRADWKYHKKICSLYGQFLSSNPRPSPTHRLALLFPVDADLPRLTWIGFITASPEALESPLYEPHLGSVLPVISFVTTQLRLAYRSEQRFKLDNSVMMFKRVRADEDGSASNQSVGHVMKDNLVGEHKGPILVFSAKSNGSFPGSYLDFQPPDLRVLTDFFSVEDTRDQRQNGGVIIMEATSRMKELLGVRDLQ